MALARFTRALFRSTDDAARAALAADLATALSELIDKGQTARQLIEVLRGLGHDLWSFDEDGDGYEVWMPNFHTPSGPGIVVTFEREGVKVEWTCTG